MTLLSKPHQTCSGQAHARRLSRMIVQERAASKVPLKSIVPFFTTHGEQTFIEPGKCVGYVKVHPIWSA